MSEGEEDQLEVVEEPIVTEETVMFAIKQDTLRLGLGVLLLIVFVLGD